MKSKSQAGRPKKVENEKNVTKTYSFKAAYAAWLSSLDEKPSFYLSKLMNKDPDFQEFVKKHFNPDFQEFVKKLFG